MNRFANVFPFGRRELDWQSVPADLVSRALGTCTTNQSLLSQDTRSCGQKDPSGVENIKRKRHAGPDRGLEIAAKRA